MERKEKVKHFGFVQFRFAVAAILFLVAGLKSYPLTTNRLPPVAQG